MRGLEGIRVVEVGEMVSAPFAAKLLADLGAEVVKVEPPEGDRMRRRGPFAGEPDPDRAGTFHYLNTNKRSVVADLETAEGRDRLAGLVDGADIVIHNVPADRQADVGLEWSAVSARRPDLVLCSITPFGITGPYSGYRAEELQVIHGGGWGWLSPGCSSRADLPPLKPFGHQASVHSGFAAAMASLAGYHAAQRTGVGDLIDFSVMSQVASMLEAGYITWSYLRENPSRLGARVLNPWRMLPTADGLIFVVCVEEDQWARLKNIMGNPDWAEMDIFDDQPARFDNEDLLHMWLGEWLAEQNTMELFHRGQAERIAFAPVYTMAEMADDPHLEARGFLAEIEVRGTGPVRVPGPPSRLANSWWRQETPAPALGEHTVNTMFEARPSRSRERDPGRPLEGVTVADFSWVWAGPYGAMQLAHLGAEVIKIESGQRPDLGRRLPLHSVDHPESLNTNAYFNQWNQGKRSVQLDLSNEEGRGVARRLALSCDVVISNYATGVMDRMGLGYEDLRAERPDVIVATISGYGHVGPYKDYMGYGPTTGPLSGLASLTGYEAGDPEEMGIALGDPAAGIATAFNIMAALVARERTGEGQWIDTTLWEATTVGAGEGWMEWVLTGDQPDRAGNRDLEMAPHNVFRCAGEDDWVAIVCADDAEFARLAAVVDGLDDPRFVRASARKHLEDEVDAALSAWCRDRDRWEITEQLQSAGVAALPSLSPADLDVDRHLETRGMLERLPHPEVGAKTHMGIPWRLAERPNGVRSAAPILGADTDVVLRTRLGLERAEIARLREAGALR